MFYSIDTCVIHVSVMNMHTCTHIFISRTKVPLVWYIHTYIHAYIHIYIYIYVYVCVCVYMFMCVYVCVCVYVRTYLYMYDETSTIMTGESARLPNNNSAKSSTRGAATCSELRLEGRAACLAMTRTTMTTKPCNHALVEDDCYLHTAVHVWPSTRASHWSVLHRSLKGKPEQPSWWPTA